jgi:hypothetical protein
MPVYKTRTFARWMKHEGLADRDLHDAISEMRDGLVDARLGGGLVKKRIARPGQGKRGGYRVLVASNFGERWVFMFGFAKNERDNIDDDELRLMKRIAATLLEMSEQTVRKALEAGELMEIKYGK